MLSPGGLSQTERKVIEDVLRALRSIRHGYVQIVVQDARAVQIETHEKRRLDTG